MSATKSVDRRFAAAVEDVTLPEAYQPDGYRVSYQPAMEFVDDIVVGYLQLELEPSPGTSNYGDDTEYETLVLGSLEEEELEPVKESDEKTRIMEGLSLNKGPVSFLSAGVPAPRYDQF